jgi:hypothetical protein
MKSEPAWIGILSLSLILVACDKKEEMTQNAKPEVPRTRPIGAEQRPFRPKPVAPAPEPAAEPQVAPSPATEAEIAQTPTEGAVETVTPPSAPPAGTKTTAELQAERQARMAKAREERTAQVTGELTTRFKEQDTNGDGLLAKDEVNDRMQRRFTDADKNGDGFLDATEQAAAIQAAAERTNNGGGQRRGRGGQGQGRGNPNP